MRSRERALYPCLEILVEIQVIKLLDAVFLQDNLVLVNLHILGVRSKPIVLVGPPIFRLNCLLLLAIIRFLILILDGIVQSTPELRTS